MQNEYMKIAIRLAQKGIKTVSPNPMVGAVIVKNNKLLGVGWHKRPGDAHAEVNAIRASKKHTSGSTLYVTLEPCCHTGRTPPCTQLILEAGIKKVVCAMIDPNPLVSGKGISFLQAHGIEVEVGILEREAKLLNRPYILSQKMHRPYIYGKISTSLDGKTATSKGESKWITSEKSRYDGYQLRSQVDAIAVGSKTILSDNPLLTARGENIENQPMRAVFDSHLNTPFTANIIQSNPGNTIIFYTDAAMEEKAQAFRQLGVQVFKTSPNKSGKVDVLEALSILHQLFHVHRVLVEGGATLLGAFADLDLLDEIWHYNAPVLIGGKNANSCIAGTGFSFLKDCLKYELLEFSQCGDDTKKVYYRKGALCLPD